MEKIKINTRYKKLLADAITPVSIYLNIKEKYKKSFLLESSDYHGNEDSYSFICFNPVASFKVQDGKIFIVYPNGEFENKSAADHDVVEELNNFSGLFDCEDLGFDFVTNGLFGFTSFEGVRHFEDIDFDYKEKPEKKVPDMHYMVFQNIISINHFKNELYLFEHRSEIGTGSGPESLDKLEEIIKTSNVTQKKFERVGEEVSNFDDAGYLKVIRDAKKHCKRGDVFQLVLSREFSQDFKGDDFTLYRALRSVNPSPYLFYFDFEDFKIFGSSPEAQIVVKNRKTFRRTGDDEADAKLAQKLLDDPKENAEHVMLVDLARNDLSRDAENVKVESYREIQFYSHVIHLVSKVTGDLLPHKNTIRLVADTFPAGTLSGAPKHKALQLINKYEKNQRGIYGGCIGFIGFNGDFNHAIIIRSFLSKNDKLFYQAGAGIVMKSDDESERQEVFNKLAALHKAMEIAEEL